MGTVTGAAAPVLKAEGVDEALPVPLDEAPAPVEEGDDADVFDHQFFRVSPREARSMSPQQRVLLQVAYHALEDAGYVPGATPGFDPDTFATYIGAATNDYVQNLQDDIDVYYSTGRSRLAFFERYAGAACPDALNETRCYAGRVVL